MQRATVRRNQYQDSVRLMTIAREAGALPGVAKVLALLGTEANRLLVSQLGLDDPGIARATANDLLICVEAADAAACEAALARVDALLKVEAPRDPGISDPSSIEEALGRLPAAKLALFSVPGPFAKLDVVSALEHGLHVMLFSDNVALEDEVHLKQLAAKKGLLLMGPDCGTAIVNGVPLAFANVVRRGAIGVVGASGTGIQEVTSLIDRFGGGISHALGVGGRDLKREVGGIMSELALRLLAEDPATRRLVLISKPGDPEVTRRVLAVAGATGLPTIACLLGGAGSGLELPGVRVVNTLEEAALAAVGRAPEPPEALETVLARARALASGRRYLRALYSGGTLCYETLLLAEGVLEVHSNIARKKELRLPYPARGKAHACIDLGEDEFTQGRPHPMIDPGLRNERLAEELADPAVRVVLLDVVLGYGSSPDPARGLAEVLARARRELPDGGPLVLAHVCGTEGDPQSLSRQEAILREAGVLLFATNAQAARAALAVAGEGAVP
ncbi:MAG TPA: acyl-CoA synthetase FdrA [Anaeromyxobacteraceae bacterium]|nr:acyl-CoA synthetase FdrA [Anaeromyxobacteraceae bacterium]